jgi:hypothetical protein
MPRFWLAGLGVLLCSSSLAQGLVADGDGFVWHQGDRWVRFDKGRFSAGLDGGRSLSFHAFLWHDAWLYETLPGGTVEAGPTLEPDGSLTQSGAFSARDGSAPMHYALRAVPEADGVRTKWQFAKTGPLPLPNGLWLHVFGDAAQFTGAERIWARPAWHGTVRSAMDSAAEALLVELQGARSLSIGGPGFRAMNREGGDSTAFRVNLLPDDFPVGETREAETLISFTDMPDHFPGDIEPGREPLDLHGVTASAPSVPRYEKLELSVDLGATYDNPYDPDDVALDAEFTAPSGKVLSVPGFFMLREARQVTTGAEMMLPEGNGEWRVRFAPREVGTYTWRLKLRDRTGEVTGGEGSFEATAGDARGFVRQSQADSRYLAFDNGEGYFAIGHNLPIYHTIGQLGDEAMRKFAAAGENYNRWWMCSYGFGIEGDGKLGWYRQDSAARIDLVLDVARELGLEYMMCMDTHQDFREGGWETNLFNARNGGPCATAGEWFTSPVARDLYRKRLRYTVARWGYSPNVLCWEFGNEFEGWADSPDDIKLDWHREMSAYLHKLDPFGHLVTTSFWGHTGPPAFWELPDIDIVQTHLYTSDDRNVGDWVRDLSLKQWTTWDKPHLFGEFGIDPRGGFEEKDPQGWGIHNALWAGLTSFCAGGPMPWWHENYIEPKDLYFHFTALASFTRDLPLGTARWEMLDTSAPEYQDKNRPPDVRDAVVQPLQRWGKPEHNAFHVLPDGTVEGGILPQALLQGMGHEDLRNEPTFTANYPRDGQFIMHVETVSNSGLLRVWVDGQQVLEREFPCGEGLGKASVYRPQWTLWETTYDEDVTVPVPAGTHTVRVDNSGKDWVHLTRYVFTGCKVLDKPNLLVAGMRADDLGVLWMQNRDSDWARHLDNSVKPVAPTVLTIQGLPDGAYDAEWWETWRGAVARTESLESRGGEMALRIRELATDMAVKLRRVE